MTTGTVLVVEDDAALAEALGDTLQLAGWRVLVAGDGERALELAAAEPVDLVVSDVHMKRMDGHALLRELRARRPELPVMLMTAYATVEKAVAAMREGAVDYLVKPFEAEVLVNMVERYAAPRTAGDELVGESAAGRELAALARKVAARGVTVMITGESGTGKEVLARYVHRHSPRAGGPFVAINCAAIPENMLEATLFGYEKGAFTGAYKACPGKFEQAQGGTLLLDEISEMDLGLQAKLLRVLQEREVERLGGQRTIQLDVRVLATSNRDLRRAVAEGRFREDLYYRLNVFPLHVPPLRERREDILPLARALLARHARAAGMPVPALADDAAAALAGHDWPGNVRELENVVQRALVLCEGGEVRAADLRFEQATASPPTPPAAADAAAGEAADGLNADLRRREWDIIIETLRSVRGSRKLTAEKLGISQRTLRYKLARMREAGLSIPGEFDAQSA